MKLTLEGCDPRTARLCALLPYVPRRDEADTVTLSLGTITALVDGDEETVAPVVDDLARSALVTEVAADMYRVAPVLLSGSVVVDGSSENDLAPVDAVRRVVEHYLRGLDRAMQVIDPEEPRYRLADLGMPEPMATATEGYAWFLAEADNFLPAVAYAYEQGWNELVLAAADRLWQLYRDTGRWMDLLEVQLLAGQVADAEGLPELVEATSRRAWALIGLDQCMEAVTSAREATRHARASRDPWRMSVALSALADAFAAQGSVGEAISAIEDALAIDLDRGASPAQMMRQVSKRAVLLMALGESERALADVREAIDMSPAPECDGERARALVVLGRIALEVGELDEALEVANAAEALYLEYPHTVHEIELDALLCDIYAALGRKRHRSVQEKAARFGFDTDGPDGLARWRPWGTVEKSGVPA